MWTPEDQADFEARHPENRVVNQTYPPPSPPTVPNQASNASLPSRFIQFLAKVTVWSGIAFAAGIALFGLSDWAGHNPSWDNHLQGYLMAPLMVCILAWIPVLCIGLVWSGLTAGKMAHEAMQPLPSLQEIDAQLRWEGFNPTVSDCVAVQQRMQSENVMKLAVAGAFFVLL